MMRRIQLGETTVLCPDKHLMTLSPLLSDARFVYIQKACFDPLNYKTIEMPRSELDTDLYFDEGNFYLTGFTIDQDVLSDPVEGVSVFDKMVEIYVGSKKFIFLKSQLKARLQKEDFYLKHSQLDSPTENSNGKSYGSRKRFIESQDVFCSQSGSNELGVISYDGHSSIISDFTQESIDLEEVLSETSEDISPCSSMANAVSETHLTTTVIEEDSNSNETSNELRPTKLVHSTTLDKRSKMVIELSHYKSRVEKLIADVGVKTTELVVSSDLITAPREFAVSDSTIKRMTDEISQSATKQLPTTDPIVVVQKDGEYQVLSGARRISAYKKMMVNKIWVSQIDENDKIQFLLANFFRSHAQDEIDTERLINVVGDLLSYIALPVHTLKQWSPCSRNKVFGSLFGKKTTLALLLDMFTFPDLIAAVKDLDKHINLSNRLAREVLTKYRCNPKETIRLLREPWISDSDLKKSILAIESDMVHLLELKGVKPEVATILSSMYSGNSSFIEFLKGADLRFTKTSQEKRVIEKFEQFKNKLGELGSNSGTPKVQIVQDNTNNCEYEVLITSDEAFASRKLQQCSTICVLLLGVSHHGQTNQVILLPDSMGVQDEDGCLNVHISISILIKQDGSLLAGKEITHYLDCCGIKNRTIFPLKEFRKLSEQMKRFFIDIGGALREELALSFISHQSVVYVSSHIHKNKLEKLLKHNETNLENNFNPATTD